MRYFNPLRKKKSYKHEKAVLENVEAWSYYCHNALNTECKKEVDGYIKLREEILIWL
jgi:hypothetical protein